MIIFAEYRSIMYTVEWWGDECATLLIDGILPRDLRMKSLHDTPEEAIDYAKTFTKKLYQQFKSILFAHHYGSKP